MYNVESLGNEQCSICMASTERKAACRSVYQDVELIPLDEFKAKAGPEYLENSDNPHQLFINRLKYELVVRAA